MKAPPFRYERPETLDGALALLAENAGEARILAGGQSLVAALNFRLDAPELLIDINRIAELGGIGEERGVLRIGALARHFEVASSPLVHARLPLIARAMKDVAHAAIRNRGTFGGSIALADPAAEMPACCLAYGGRIVLAGLDGTRRVDADDFFLGLYETAREEGEIVTGVEFDRPADLGHERFAFAELARRHGDYAMAGIAMVLRGEPAVEEARIVLFGVSDRPVRALAAEEALAGTPCDEMAIEAAVAAVCEGVEFSGDLNASEETRMTYARVLLRRSLAGMRKEAQAA